MKLDFNRPKFVFKVSSETKPDQAHRPTALDCLEKPWRFTHDISLYLLADVVRRGVHVAMEKSKAIYPIDWSIHLTKCMFPGPMF